MIALENLYLPAQTQWWLRGIDDVVGLVGSRFQGWASDRDVPTKFRGPGGLSYCIRFRLRFRLENSYLGLARRLSAPPCWRI